MDNIDNFQVCFVNTNQEPEKRRHICYYTKDEGNNEISLYGVEELTFKHPQAEDYAFITVIVTNKKWTRKRHEFEAAPLILLEAAQKNTQKI